MTIEAKYGGYIARQAEQVERFRRLEDKPLPPDLDYHAIPQLRAEAREKFSRVRPRSLGQAGRISGINPADIATLLVYLKRSPHPLRHACKGRLAFERAWTSPGGRARPGVPFPGATGRPSRSPPARRTAATGGSTRNNTGEITTN